MVAKRKRADKRTAEQLAKDCANAGRQRAKVLTAKQRSAIARAGALARWAGKNEDERKAERARGREPQTKELVA